MDLAHQPALRLGSLEVRPSTREIVFAGGREIIEPRVMMVLLALAKAGGEVVTRDELISACWEGRAVSDDAINRVISRIRRISELTAGRDFTLETITKVGYRLVVHPQAQAEAVASPAPAAPVSPTPRRRSPLVIGVTVLAALAIFIAVGWWLMRPGPPAAPQQTLTLAVLPFGSDGPDGNEDPLATGMAREIRNTLSRVRGLRVVSDASSFAVAAEKLDAASMGKRLGADLLLDGSYTRQGETVKLTAELIDGKTGFNEWTGSQDGALADLDRLRVLMSSAIFEQLVARIGPNRLEMTAPPKASDPRVYALVLEVVELQDRAGSMRRQGNIEASLDLGDKAYDLIQQALKIEPDSALALATMATIIYSASTHELWNSGRSIPDLSSAAADYARRAVAIDPDNVRGLQLLGAHYERDAWRWADALPLLERALAIDPNDFNTRIFYSWYLSSTGRCLEALQQVRTVLMLDPESQARSLQVPRQLKCVGRLKESADTYGAILDAHRSDLFLITEIYLSFLVQRDAPALRRMAAHVRDDLWGGKPTPPVQAALDRVILAADALEGRPEAYRALLADDAAKFEAEQAKAPPAIQGRRSSDTNWTYAIEFAFAGETDRAIGMLQRAIAAGSLYIPETMPYGASEFTPEMRADPRYQAIWNSDPRLVELKRLRLEALQAGQMSGVLPDGRKVTPKGD